MEERREDEELFRKAEELLVRPALGNAELGRRARLTDRRKKSRPHADRQNGWRMSSTAAAINWSAAAQRDRPRAAHTLTAHNSPRWPAHQGGPPKHAAHAGERKSQTSSTTNFRPQAIHVPKGWSAKFYPVVGPPRELCG